MEKGHLPWGSFLNSQVVLAHLVCPVLALCSYAHKAQTGAKAALVVLSDILSPHKMDCYAWSHLLRRPRFGPDCVDLLFAPFSNTLEDASYISRLAWVVRKDKSWLATFISVLSSRCSIGCVARVFHWETFTWALRIKCFFTMLRILSRPAGCWNVCNQYLKYAIIHYSNVPNGVIYHVWNYLFHSWH